MRDALLSGPEQRPASWIDAAARSLSHAWDDVPAWARSPLAIGLLCAVLVVTFLGSLALVVNGVVERSEARQRGEVLQAQGLRQCAAQPRQARSDDCLQQLASARRQTHPYERIRPAPSAGVTLVSLQR